MEPYTRALQVRALQVHKEGTRPFWLFLAANGRRNLITPNPAMRRKEEVDDKEYEKKEVEERQ